MDTTTIILVIVQGHAAGLFFLFAHLIKKKKYYGLISGFSMKSEAEQEELIKNGYPQAVGNIMSNSAWILLIGLILLLLGLEAAILWSYGILMLYMFGHLLYISKRDAKRVRKRNFIILVSVTVITLGGVGTLFYLGEQPNYLTVTEEEVVVSGMYGLTWPLTEITNVELVEEIPRIRARTNGFSTSQRAKGKYRLDELGSGTLFLYRDHPPFLVVQKGEDYFIINSENESETIAWFENIGSVLVK
ncbi:DUF3784 domain-containing protein [Anaerobacillus alkaliphilus]|uniref:DUF3784 domain-containing protein n=1 Tax=Anaerobacillus alkaliphilus TaxID=1548597 RepID=A0A4V1LFR0_9BACI|nr:DUF3784 domain-containing protein [Anaerobacillus alkaliphilus]RXI96159.1 DUF3784 domain-containing protein [Anaerobacillus alkaliphilus]